MECLFIYFLHMTKSIKCDACKFLLLMCVFQFRSTNASCKKHTVECHCAGCMFYRSCGVTVCGFCVFLFSIGLLFLAKALDRETIDQYRLIVTASDGHPGGVKLQPSLLLKLLEYDFSLQT